MKSLKNKNFKILIITLSIISVLSVLSIGENSVISGGINAAMRGLFQVSAYAVSSADSPSYDELAEENSKLKAENAQLREQLVDYIDTRAENERLWRFYELKKENPSYDIKPANVIKRDTNDDFYSFTLDIGSIVGVSVNDPVITENGLVGWVSQVDMATCRVKTVLSPDTKAGVLDKISGDSGILSGTAVLCDKKLTSMGKLAEYNKIKEGDLVVTSGSGGVYPANLVVGRVRELRFNSYDASRCAIIEPIEDVSSITAAAVITDFSNKGEVKRTDEN